MKRARLWLALLAALASAGCFRTVVRSGHPPAEAPESHDERWHSGWVGGLIEASGPHSVAEACPEGWAEVRTETDPLHSFLNVLTTFIYSPQEVTVVCAAKGAPPAPPLAGYEVTRAAYPPPPPPPKEITP